MELERENENLTIDPKAGLVGWWFFTTTENGREIRLAGHVLARVEPGVYLCDLQNWLDGGMNASLLDISDLMVYATFYRSADGLREAMEFHRLNFGRGL